MIAFADFPAPLRLMLLTLRWQLTLEEQIQTRALIEAGMDWDALLDVATHHRVEPLVFAVLEKLRAAGVCEVPPDVLAPLQRAATVNAFRAALSTTEFARIVKSFAREGFELTVLKGVALSQQVYGSPSVRHVGDLDLLCSREGLERQFKLMEELGYQLTIPEARMTPRRIASLARYWKDATFVGREDESTVELHWRLFNSPQHPGNRILDVADYTQATIFGLPVRTLSVQDQFLHQAAHGVSDAWIYLKSLADVAGYLRRLSADELDEALAKADFIGLLAQVSAAVHLANDWLGANVNNARLLPATHPVGVAVRERTEHMLLARSFKPMRDDRSPADWTRLELQVLPGLSSKMEVAARLLNRPRLWTQVDLPDPLFWLYPVVGALVPPRRHVPVSDVEPAVE